MNDEQVIRVVTAGIKEYVLHKTTNSVGDTFTLMEIVESRILLKRIKNAVKDSDLEAVNTVLKLLKDIDNDICNLLKQNEV